MAAQPVLNDYELSQLIEAQRVRFGDERVAHNFEGWNKTMQYYFTDVGAYYVIRLVDGKAQPAERLEKPLHRPDIAYEMDTGTLLSMTLGRVKRHAGLQAEAAQAQSLLSGYDEAPVSQQGVTPKFTKAVRIQLILLLVKFYLYQNVLVEGFTVGSIKGLFSSESE